MGSSSRRRPSARACPAARAPRKVAGERPSVRASSIAPVCATSEDAGGDSAARATGVGVREAVHELAAGRRERGLLERRQQRERQEEREVEDRMAVVRDLGVQHPRAVGTEQDVLGRVVAVHEARARVAQLVDERLERRGEVGEPLHHDSVIRLQPQLGERLVVAERRGHLGVARRGGVQAPERLAGPATGCGMRAPGEHLGLPVAPTARRMLQDDDVLDLVAVDDGRHAAGDDTRGEPQRRRLGVGAARRGDPLVCHAQPRQRLLDDQRDPGPAHREHGARDTARQLLDGQLGTARNDPASREIVGHAAGSEHHRGGSACVQSTRSPS